VLEAPEGVRPVVGFRFSTDIAESRMTAWKISDLVFRWGSAEDAELKKEDDLLAEVQFLQVKKNLGT
jgi:hypothetical protein